MSQLKISGNASGTGVFTVASPNSNNTQTLTLPDNTGTLISTASTFAGTGPAFSAYQSVAQTLSTTTWTKIQLQSEEFDTNNNFDSATNYRFTPTVAGYYQFEGSFAVNSFVTQIQIAIYKNGSNAKQGGNVATNAGQLNVSCLIYMNGSTDYVELYGWLGAGQALGGASTVTYFQGFLARAA